MVKIGQIAGLISQFDNFLIALKYLSFILTVSSTTNWAAERPEVTATPAGGGAAARPNIYQVTPVTASPPATPWGCQYRERAVPSPLNSARRASSPGRSIAGAAVKPTEADTGRTATDDCVIEFNTTGATSGTSPQAGSTDSYSQYFTVSSQGRVSGLSAALEHGAVSSGELKTSPASTGRLPTRRRKTADNSSVLTVLPAGAKLAESQVSTNATPAVVVTHDPLITIATALERSSAVVERRLELAEQRERDRKQELAAYKREQLAIARQAETNAIAERAAAAKATRKKDIATWAGIIASAAIGAAGVYFQANPR